MFAGGKGSLHGSGALWDCVRLPASLQPYGYADANEYACGHDDACARDLGRLLRVSEFVRAARERLLPRGLPRN